MERSCLRKTEESEEIKIEIAQLKDQEIDPVEQCERVILTLLDKEL